VASETLRSDTLKNSQANAEPATRQGGPYAWYVVAVLILAYTFSFIDRQALTLMVGPIRETLQISDTELSLLHGFAFALFYTVMGIPLGRMVDQRRRTTIIAAGIVIWSVMTAFCGLARNFVQMFLARIGVGIGEAALSPGAYSLIGDYFPPQQRTQALSIYIGAAYVGSGLAIMIGGTLIALMPPMDVPWLGHLEPWQGVFIAIGLPGVLVALLVLGLREPTRTSVKPGVEPHFRKVLAHIGRQKGAYGLAIFGYSLLGLIWNGALAWLPTFFMRIFGWTASEVGFRYGLVIIIAGTLGSVVGGVIAGSMRNRGRTDANIVIGLISLAVVTPSGMAMALAGDAWTALGLTFVFLFGCALPWGAAVAALHEITPNQMRGQVAAIYLFSLSFLGMGFGPTIVALFTDSVFASDMALGKSLAATIAIIAPFSAIVLWLSRKPYKLALDRVDF
jgi:MFS family permease